MNGLASSLLELGFYYHDRPDADAFGILARALLEHGAILTGEVWVWRSPHARIQPFSSATELQVHEATMDLPGLVTALSDPDQRITAVALANASELGAGRAMLSYTSVSDDAAAHDQRHPIALLLQGSLFVGDVRSHVRRQTGQRVYHRFLQLVAATRPSYGAITCEIPLECPFDLQRDPRSQAFFDFYISEQFVGIRTAQVLANSYRDAFVQRIASGLYISCNSDFNPAALSLPYEFAASRSCDVARMIGRATA